MNNLTRPDKVTITIRIFIKFVALLLLFTQEFTAIQIGVAILIILATEAYEIPAMAYAITSPIHRTRIYSIIGPINMIVIVGILYFLNILNTELYLIALFANFAFGIPSGLNAALISGIVSSALYLFATSVSTDLDSMVIVFRSMLLFMASGISGLVSHLYIESDQEKKHLLKTLEDTHISEELKNEFVSLASHNLRAPLTVIKGYLEVLEETQPGSDDFNMAIDRIGKKLTVFDEQAKRLIKLADLASKRMKFNFNLKKIEEIVESLIDKYSSLAKDHGLTFTYTSHIDSDTIIKCDEEQLKASIDNLLSNAVKYNTTGSYISLSIDEHGDSISVSVSDDGGGVPQDIGKRMFSKYARSKEHQSQAGTGLGLYLSQQIVEAHGGKISLNNHPPVAEFIISLPKYVKSDLKDL
ncbi:HAMP domain-containing histidine kinase [bacterium]|nr:HAMP domain-containing histidine kinase [bacterium]